MEPKSCRQKQFEFTFQLFGHARMAVRYGTPQFLLRSTVRFFCNGARAVYNSTSTVQWYAV